MYKIIIFATPVAGHFNPFVPIMKKLVERGHDVLCLTGKIFKTQVENTGASFQPTLEEWDPLDRELYDFFPELKRRKGLSQVKYYLKHVLYDSAPDLLKMLEKVYKTFPADVLISDTFMIAGGWFTELNGPPNIRLSVLPLSLPGKNIAPFGLGLLPRKSFFSKLRNNLLNVILEKVLFKDVQNYSNKIRNSVGLPPFDKSLFLKGYELSNLVFHTSTPAFEYPRKEFPANLRFIGPVIIPPQVNYNKPDWWPEIEKDIPVILINQGTLAKNINNLILPAIEALKDEKMVVLAVPVKNNQIMDLPSNTFTEPYIPFADILPHVDIMITNGGYGGTQNALAHGVPLIIAGATEDKMEVASRLEYSGAGINLRKQNPSPENIRKAVMKILSDESYKQKAKELQIDFAKYDAPTLAVELIEELLNKQRGKTLHNLPL
jgi:MGT family glycosyltransferase